MKPGIETSFSTVATGANATLDEGTTLLSIVLSLRPLQEGRRPRPVARAAHALLLQAVAWSDPELAEAIHSSSGPRPFTVSNLFEWNGRPAIRFTALSGGVAQALARALDQTARGPLAPGAILDLDHEPYRVDQPVVHNDAHPWAGQASYGTMAFPWVYGSYAPEVRLTLQFVSPTTFRSHEMNHPTPLPTWVFGSLLEKWNAFAPVPLPETVRGFAATRMALSRYRLETMRVPFKGGSIKFGAVGVATYTAPRPDEATMRALNLLADFAFYAGVGAGTTMGFGQCRRIPRF